MTGRCKDTLNGDRCTLAAGHVETFHRGERPAHFWHVAVWVERARAGLLPAKAAA